MEEWHILKLRFWEDMSQSEVAEMLGLNQSTVSRREEQALKHICNNL
jgi:RNA polymerase sigma factor (sigma-70 family)